MSCHRLFLPFQNFLHTNPTHCLPCNFLCSFQNTAKSCHNFFVCLCQRMPNPYTVRCVLIWWVVKTISPYLKPPTPWRICFPLPEAASPLDPGCFRSSERHRLHSTLRSIPRSLLPSVPPHRVVRSGWSTTAQITHFPIFQISLCWALLIDKRV